LRCEHEQSRCNIGDLGFERQPVRPGKSNDYKSCAGADHPGAKIELSKGHLTIIKWTTNNPGGSPLHYGIVHDGTDPNSLIETAKSPIRLNSDQSSTVFRVRLDNLKPQTTYYTFDSMDATGKSDGVPLLFPEDRARGNLHDYWNIRNLN
jgi:hypothetical protein